MSEDRDPHKAVDYILLNGKKFAKAKAERCYIEEYRKSLKAILMKRSMENASGAQEREAYASPRYKGHLEALKPAVERRERLRWMLIAAQARIEVWRSQEASNRNIERATL